MAKVRVSLPDEFLKKVDRTAKAQGRSRIERIREAPRLILTGKENGRRPWKEALAPLKQLEQQRVGRWDSPDIIPMPLRPLRAREIVRKLGGST